MKARTRRGGEGGGGEEGEEATKEQADDTLLPHIKTPRPPTLFFFVFSHLCLFFFFRKSGVLWCVMLIIKTTVFSTRDVSVGHAKRSVCRTGSNDSRGIGKGIVGLEIG